MNSILKTLLVIYLMSIHCMCELVAQNLSVFVSPHPDDWQLFMNPNAYKQLSSSDQKVIFLHVTAGDAGLGSGNPYYLSREEGSIRAIRFMTYTLSGEYGSPMTSTIVNVNGHSILKKSHNNAVAYFLRLPDGNVNGAGYAIHNYQSLKRLYKGLVTTISAIDGSTTYNSLNDLETTLLQIIQLESTASGNIQFNLADTVISINPGDHTDHIYSSTILQEVANLVGKVTLNLYQEYVTANEPQNVFGDDYLINTGTWGITVSGLTDEGSLSTWESIHNVWVGKQYFRTIEVNNSTP